MQGVDLEQVRQRSFTKAHVMHTLQVKLFASEFKSARLQLGLTQTQVGLALTNTSEEQAVSQSTICRYDLQVHHLPTPVQVREAGDHSPAGEEAAPPTAGLAG